MPGSSPEFNPATAFGILTLAIIFALIITAALLLYAAAASSREAETP